MSYRLDRGHDRGTTTMTVAVTTAITGAAHQPPWPHETTLWLCTRPATRQQTPEYPSRNVASPLIRPPAAGTKVAS